jgi:hypothetical protein
MGVLRGIGRGIAGTAAVAGAGAAWAGRGLGFGNTMAAGLAAGGLFKTAASNAFNGSKSANKDKGSGEKSIPLDKMSGGIPSALAEIQKEVSLIRKILETQPDPESQEQEKIIEEDARNRRLLAAISSLRLGGPGGGGKKEGFFDKLKGILGTILGMLGLASLPIVLANAAEVWDKISGAMDTLAGWLKNIDEFFENLGVQWAGMAMMGTAKAMQLRQKIIDFKNKVKDSYRRIKSAFKGFTEKWSSRISKLSERLGKRLTFITKAWNWVVGLKGRAIAGWSKFIKTTWPNWKTNWKKDFNNGPWRNITVAWEKVQTKWGNIIKNWDRMKANWALHRIFWFESFKMTVESIPTKITAAMKIAKTALITSFDDWKKTNWTPISEKFATWKTTFSSWAKKIPGWEKSWFGVRAAWGVTSTAVSSAIAGIPEEWKKIKATWISMFERFTKRVTGLLPKWSTNNDGGRRFLTKFNYKSYNKLRLGNITGKISRGPNRFRTKLPTTPKALVVASNKDPKPKTTNRRVKTFIKPKTTPGGQSAYAKGFDKIDWGERGRGERWKSDRSWYARNAATITKLFGPGPASFAESWLGKNPSAQKWAEKALRFAINHPVIAKMAKGLTKFLGKATVKGLGWFGVLIALMELLGLVTTWQDENDKPWNWTPFGNDNKADENFMKGLKNMGKIYGVGFIGAIIGSSAFGAIGTAIGGPVAGTIAGFVGGFAGGMIGAMVTSMLLEEEETNPEIQAINDEIAEIDRMASQSGYIGQEEIKRLKELQKKRTELRVEDIKEKKHPTRPGMATRPGWSASSTDPYRFGYDWELYAGMGSVRNDSFSMETAHPGQALGHKGPRGMANITPSIVLDGAGSSENSNQTLVISYDSSSSSHNRASTTINEKVYVSASGPHRGHDFYGTSGGGGW